MSFSDDGSSSLRLRVTILLGVVTVLIGLPVAALEWMTSVPGRSWQGPPPPPRRDELVLASRLGNHIRGIASEPHNVAHPAALERSARYLEQQLEGLGYPVRRQPFSAGGILVRNLEVEIESAAPGAPQLVIGAHYDSFAGAPGANDNATGAAAVVELARLLRDLRGRSAFPIRLVLFVNEEPPWFQTEAMGSRVHARDLARRGAKLRGMISLETLGFYSERPGSQHYPAPLGAFYPDKGDFVAFVARVGSRSFVRRTVRDFRAGARIPSEGGAAPGFLAGIDWSDHWAFAEQGYPALMVTDTAPFRYPYYHMPADTPDKVDALRLARVVAGLALMIRRWAASGG